MGEKLTTVEIFQEPKFKQLLGRVREYNAYGIGNLINAYDPEKIIVMGSLGLKQFNKVIPEPSLIRRYTMSKRIPEVLPTVLGEEIGLLGAFFSAKKV